VCSVVTSWPLVLAGGVITTVLRYAEQQVMRILSVSGDGGWQLTAMLALGYPLGHLGVAANRRPVHEVSSRNQWHQPLGVEVPGPLWPPARFARKAPLADGSG
jgi:hypothetical protein